VDKGQGNAGFKTMNMPMDKKRQKLSAVIITLNEERALPKCLQSVEFVDEIIVVDSGSTDRTCEIAQQMEGRVIQQDWLGYGRQKQFAVEQAEHDWVLCLDADEWISDELRASIISTLEKPGYHAYQFPRCNRFMGRWLRHGEGYPDYNLRLYHRAYAHWSDDPVHEHVKPDTSVGKLPGDLMHESEEGLESYLEKQNRYSSLQAKILFEQGVKPSIMKILISPAFRFVKFYLVRGGWRDGVPGLVHVSVGCFNTYMKNVKLWALVRRSKER
jgi:glycosyltransferase involved in cell wall biosynthesis